MCFTGEGSHEKPTFSAPPNGLSGPRLLCDFGVAGLRGWRRLQAEMLQLLLPGGGSLRLFDKYGRGILHFVLRDQHKDLQVHRDLLLLGPQLLPQVAVFQKRLLLAGSLLFLLRERLLL